MIKGGCFMKKKLVIMLTIILSTLIILPFIFTKIAKPHEFMGVMIILFFIINPHLCGKGAVEFTSAGELPHQ